MDPKIRRKNWTVLAGLLAVVGGMAGLSFAAVPLYALFCQVTGYGGTPQVAGAEAGRVLERSVKIRFNADVNHALAWDFAPETREVEVRLGETGLVSYRAHNRSQAPLVGTATYNVTPLKAGIYFNKLQCFCFEEQRLEPGQSVDMPVAFFVDPAMAEDPDMADVGTITLSYTFFRAKSDATPQQVSENNPGSVEAGAD